MAVQVMVHVRGKMGNYIHLIRVKHWIKNTFVFAPLIFSLNFLNEALLLKNILAFASFCFVASSVYILNDIFDREKDRQHPQKKDRPIASGKVSILQAALIGVLLLGLSVFMALLTNIYVVLVIAAYLLINIAYSLYLKHLVILDVMIIAAGFILRVLTGAVAIGVNLSHWMLLTTMFTSLFLGFAKRRTEITHLDESQKPRPVLAQYSVQVLNYLIVISLALTIITYSLYVIDPDTVLKTNTEKLIYTVPLVVYALFRYLYLIFINQQSEDVAEVILKDKSILITAALWIIIIVGILYHDNLTIF